MYVVTRRLSCEDLLFATLRVGLSPDTLYEMVTGWMDAQNTNAWKVIRHSAHHTHFFFFWRQICCVAQASLRLSVGDSRLVPYLPERQILMPCPRPTQWNLG
jgi:hypothetical protein